MSVQSEVSVGKDRGNSYFEGGVGEYLGYSILSFLLTVFTLGFGIPWVVCMWGKFIAKNTVISGQRMKFEGSGGSLFGNWIVWMLLTFITFGIYGFWVGPKLLNWVATNTKVDN